MRFFFVFLLLILLAACDPAPAPSAPRRLVACATVYPLADVVRQVGGEQVRVDWIQELGDPVLLFRATPAERERLTSVDLLICDGLRSDGWASQAILSLQESGKIVALDQLPVVHTTPATGVLWLDPVVVRDMVPQLVEKLAFQMPAQADGFRERARIFLDRLDTLLKAHPNSVFGRGRVIVTTTMFDPLLDRFGVAAVLVEANPLRLDQRDFDRLSSRARRDKIRAILLPFDTPSGAVADLEARTGLTAFRIDPLGLPQYADHSDYLEILDYNLTQLESATRR